MAPELADVYLARRRIAPYLRPTPLIRPAALGRALGADVHLKLENLQPIGAFKVRGGINLVSTERASLDGRRLLAASTGNHGQSVAYAAREFGLGATIYAPEGANALKVESMRALGAEVVLTGRDFDAAREACEAAAAASGDRYVHSMNEPLLVAGVGTAYLEAIEAAPDADLLIVPVGGGSGVSGAGLVAKSINPRIRVVGVQAEGAPAFYRSFHSGRLESTERIETRAEGLATRQAFDLPLAMAKRYVDDVVLVSDAEMEEAMRLLMETAHVVAEMAGAAPLAAARRLGVKGLRVIMPVSGGNATREQLAAVWRDG
jgi:threonine dehydratase